MRRGQDGLGLGIFGTTQTVLSLLPTSNNLPLFGSQIGAKCDNMTNIFVPFQGSYCGQYQGLLSGRILAFLLGNNLSQYNPDSNFLDGLWPGVISEDAIPPPTKHMKPNSAGFP